METLIFEIVENEGDRQVFYHFDGVKLCRFEGDEITRNRILQEASQWELLEKGTYEISDFVHDDDSKGTYENHADNAYIVSKDGHFVGFVSTFYDVSSYGMSYSKEEKAGLFFTDGRTLGTTQRDYSHCSTEKDETFHGMYYIHKKQI